MIDRSEKVELVCDVKEYVDSFVVMRELSGKQLKGQFIQKNINSFNVNFIFKRDAHKSLIIHVNALKKEVIAEIDELRMYINTSRVDVLKKYKRIVVVPGRQGRRIIHIPLKNANEVQKILQDLNDWL